jgi:hypothetical protein
MGLTTFLPAAALSQDASDDRLATAEARIDELEQSLADLERRVAALEGETPTPAAVEQSAPTPTPQSATLGTSTRDQPIPMGVLGQVGDWTIVVNSVNSAAEGAILGENSFNSPPAPGMQFFMVGITATYNGTESAQPSFSLSFKSVGKSNVAYNTFSPGCGVIPANLGIADEVFSGGTIEGNVCFPVAQEDANSLVMYVEPMFSGSDSRTWFSLERDSESLDG